MNLVGSARKQLGTLELTGLLGYNRGQFDGDAAKDINARFRTATGNTSYDIAAGARTPGFSSAIDRNAPANFTLQSSTAARVSSPTRPGPAASTPSSPPSSAVAAARGSSA